MVPGPYSCPVTSQRATGQQGPGNRPLLTDRGRAAASALVTLGLLGGLWVIDRSVGHDPGRAGRAPSPAASSTPPSPSPPAPSSATPTPGGTPSAREGDAGEVKGMVHTGLLGTGTWTTSTIAIAPASRQPRVHTLVVKAEGGTGIDANAAAHEVMAVLSDRRGWTGVQGQSFQLVTDPAAAEFTVYLASPGRVQKMCPLDVQMTWSCSAGTTVLLNTDRWLYRTPSYTDLAAYRAYMVNHEVGHYIGHGHRPCGGPGKEAPVMMQQSKGLDGCRANPWPLASERG